MGPFPRCVHANRRPAATLGRTQRGLRPLWFVLGLAATLAARATVAGPFADAVVAFHPGAGAGYGQDLLPEVVLGPPRGRGLLEGSLDVVSLGHGGEIVLRFDPPVACNGPGPDILVFENPFHAGGVNGPVFAELAFVAVSQDGVHFAEFPWDAQSWRGLAGKTPVLSNPENGIDPLDPAQAGGDAFDLDEVGLPWIRFVRITDAGDRVADPGNRLPGGGMAGFDLDAVAAVHPCAPENPSPTVTSMPPQSPTNTPTRLSSPSPTPTFTPRVLPTVTPTELCPVVLGLMDAIFDGQGAADWNNDGRISAADLVAAIRESACWTRDEF
ncbi:hypothetical protein HRbin30_01690 [bacterium HR30]|nr:hypothetical protein HRbin30_01690 [bacterium HR30]